MVNIEPGKLQDRYARRPWKRSHRLVFGTLAVVELAAFAVVYALAAKSAPILERAFQSLFILAVTHLLLGVPATLLWVGWCLFQSRHDPSGTALEGGRPRAAGPLLPRFSLLGLFGLTTSLALTCTVVRLHAAERAAEGWPSLLLYGLMTAAWAASFLWLGSVVLREGVLGAPRGRDPRLPAELPPSPPPCNEETGAATENEGAAAPPRRRWHVRKPAGWFNPFGGYDHRGF